jgi:hypothetical protein
MAQCRKCGAHLGCGCQLKDGLCAMCYGTLHKLINFCKHAFS